MASKTAFPLGIYIGNPNGNDAVANARFKATFDTFVATLGGARPAFMDGFVDYGGAPGTWAGNASWTAWSWARTGDSYVGPGSGVTPVIGVPLAGSATGWANVDAFYKAIINGTYDAAYKGIVDAWAGQGYKTIQMRIGYEFDGNFMPWAPGNSAVPSANADFIAAWQHVADLMHAQGIADHATVQTVWNPDQVNWASTAPAKLYAGDQYVDIISSDVYSPAWRLDLTDWSTGGTRLMTDATAWAAIAANRAHYWQYTDGNLYNPTGNGAGWSMQTAIAFAKAHNKPFSISETGAGGDGAGLGPADDPAFPQWLAGALAQAQAAGVTVQNVNIWALNQADGSWGFLNGQKPAEAVAWNTYFGDGSVPTLPPTISLSAPGSMAEATAGAGVTVTETITTTGLTGPVYVEVLTAAGLVETAYVPVLLTNHVAQALVHMARTGDRIVVVDNPISPMFTATSAAVTVTPPPPTYTLFTSGTAQEASAGAGVTMPLWITGANLTGNIYYQVMTAAGTIETGYKAALPDGASITVPVAISPQKTNLTFFVQVAFNYVPNRANLQYSWSTGGVTYSSFASNSSIVWSNGGQLATIPITNGVAVPHYFQVRDSTAATPLQSGLVVYQVGATGSGGIFTVAAPVPVGTTATFTILPHIGQTGDVIRVVNNPTTPTVIATSAPVIITTPVVVGGIPPVSIGSGAHTLALQVSEDAWQGHAQYTVAVDGTQIGGVQLASAGHGSGQSKTLNVMGSFGAGRHVVTVNFLNDLFGGTVATDRNLYVVGATIDGATVAGATITALSQGPQSFSFIATASATPTAMLAATLAAVTVPRNIITLAAPVHLAVGRQTITGSETDASQAVFVDWHNNGAPAINATDWVRATVSSAGKITATVTVDHPGVAGTLYYHVGTGPVTVAWKATPV